ARTASARHTNRVPLVRAGTLKSNYRMSNLKHLPATPSKYSIWLLLVGIACLLLAFALYCTSSPSGLNGVNVAIYEGSGVSGFAEALFAGVIFTGIGIRGI